jgi:triphosphatase
MNKPKAKAPSSADDSTAAQGDATIPTPPINLIKSTKASPLKFKKRMRLADGVQCIFKNCIEQSQSNARGVVLGDVESLHQMRIGLRRLRAALSMVKDIVALPKAMSDDLEWLVAQLGTARNWDVFCAVTLNAVPKSAIDDGEFAQIQAAALEQAAHHRHKVSQAIESRRYTKLMLALTKWLSDERWTKDGGGAKKLQRGVAKGAVPLVEKAAARLRKRSRTLDLDDPACLHSVRIAAKKARYSVEFFRSLLPAKRVSAYIAALSALQDQLGAVNDQRVAQDILVELRAVLPDSLASLRYIEGFIQGAGQAKAQAARRDIHSHIATLSIH